MIPAQIVVGVLAGGRGARFGGADKGWIERNGRAQIEHVLASLQANATVLEAEGPGHIEPVHIEHVLVSANRNLDRYRALGVEGVPDRWPAFLGPMAGIASLIEAQAGIGSDAMLLTLPVDHCDLPREFVLRMLATAATFPDACVVASDGDGIQPLMALYSPRRARKLAEAFAAGERSVRRWQQTQALRICPFEPLRFGNLNTPDDLTSP